jgi:phage tail sheath protein FI
VIFLANFKHGIYREYAPTQTRATVTAESAHTVCFGVAPMANATDPVNANEVVYCLGLEDFQKKFGWSEDFLTYNLCGDAYALFVLHGVESATFCSQLDAKNDAHLDDVSETIYARQKYGNPKWTAFGNFGIVPETLKLYLTDSSTGEKIGNALEEGTDYRVFTQNWQYGFSPILGGAIFSLNPTIETVQISAEYQKLIPANVSLSDIAGGRENGIRKGIECAKDVYGVTKHAPSILCASGWSKHAEIYAKLASMCDLLNARFDCTFVADVDSGANGARRYEQVADAQEKAGQNDFRSKIIWGCGKVGSYTIFGSSLLAALMNAVDADTGSPYASESNHDLNVNGICLEDGTAINLSLEEANELNPLGVTVGVFDRGMYVCWGNYSASGTSDTDPAHMWHNMVRFIRWKERSFVLTYAQMIDLPLKNVNIQMILDMENTRILGEVNQGISPGGSLSYISADNSTQEMLNGNAIFRYEWATYPPMQSMTCVYEFDVDVLTQELQGGNA